MPKPRARTEPRRARAASAPRRLRADAERNRQRVLEVAEAVFAAEGLGVPIDEIARRAGLGVGTLYRHFPTKEALFAAIVAGRVARATARAVELAGTDAGDAGEPGDRFFAFLGYLVEQGATKKDLVDALAGAGVDLARAILPAKRGFRAAFGALLARAQTAGAVRDDVAIDDVLAIVSGVFAAIDRHPGGRAASRDAAARTRDHLLAIACDGLRPPRRGPS